MRDPAILVFPPGDVFIETGLRDGDTLAAAADSGQYRALHSIEIDPVVAERGRVAFRHDPRITIWTGDSASILSTLCRADAYTVFWLDAHLPGCPVLAELSAIAAVPWRQLPTILIDEAPLFDRDHYDEADVLARYQGQLTADFYHGELQTWPTLAEMQAVLGPSYGIRTAERARRAVPWLVAEPVEVLA